MRLMMLSMLSSNSLSAFSASLAQGGINPSSGINAPSGVSRVRAVELGAQSTVAPAPKLVQPDTGGTGAPPSRLLPRGSLLDMSV